MARLPGQTLRRGRKFRHWPRARWNQDGQRALFFHLRSTDMGLATYAITAIGEKWGILHDGNIEGDYVTKDVIKRLSSQGRETSNF